MSYPAADPYKTMPATPPAGPSTPKVGPIPEAQGGAIAPTPPPAINSSAPGAPTQAKPLVPPPTPSGTTPLGQQWGGSPNGGAAPAPAPKPAPWAPTPAPAPASTGDSAAPAPYGADLNSELTNWYKSIIGGADAPFSPDRMATLKGGLFSAANGQADTAIDQAKQNALSRGMFRSGLPTDAILSARASAGQNYTKGVADLESQAGQANASQKMSALSALQQSLASDRDYQLKDYQVHKGTPGPDYGNELDSLLASGGTGDPTF